MENSFSGTGRVENSFYGRKGETGYDSAPENETSSSPFLIFGAHVTLTSDVVPYFDYVWNKGKNA